MSAGYHVPHFAPWNEKEVANIKAYQMSPLSHPYTCSDAHGKMAVSREGLECQQCPFQQRWVSSLVASGTTIATAQSVTPWKEELK